ncbi:hypothetical protein CspHIS471_0211670 [Cutaneotrichosporon sp. HIS471]|nr:hypothetical protein CspHIS471_0211670 [Cutaneotrichosporon sp. HIS471]
MYLPPWLAASLATLNIATSDTPDIVASIPDQPAPVYMATDGQLFMNVDKVEEGAVARLVKASYKAPTAWVWSPRKESRPDHVRIMVDGSDPALCLAAPVDANGTPKAGDLHLVSCHDKLDELAGGASKDPSRWTMMDEPAGTVSFHLPRGLFMGYSDADVGATNNYMWSSGWVGLAADERLD